MTICSSRTSWTLAITLLLASAGNAWAQRPLLTGLVPLTNASAAARTVSLILTFDQPLTAAAGAALNVFSSQRGGLLTRGTTPARVSGNSLSYAPTIAYRAGETIHYTVTTAAASSTGALLRPHVGQFTTAAGGAGRGTFGPGSDTPVGAGPKGVALSDVNGDGSLDLLSVNAGANTVSVRLNTGTGGYAATGGEVAVGSRPYSLVTGDVDGDGDLDLVVPNSNANTVSVRLNNGTGTFSGSQEVPVGQTPYTSVLGDVDGDGDLDLLTSNYDFRSSSVSIRFNNGLGSFSGNQQVAVGDSNYSVAVGDVDNDGDLDLVASCYASNANTVSVRLNNGAGVFSGTQEVPVGPLSWGLALGDVDGDGDLDLVTASSNANSPAAGVSLCRNDGTGTFSSNTPVSIGSSASYSVVLGDVDADGDLDLLTTNYSLGTVSVRVNDGMGSFSGNTEVSVGGTPWALTIGDVDGDGDVDLVAGTDSNNTVSMRLNGGTALATSAGRSRGSLQLFPLPTTPGGLVTLTGVAPFARFSVVDAVGRLVLTHQVNSAGTAHFLVPASLPAGMYLMRCGPAWVRLLVE